MKTRFFQLFIILPLLIMGFGYSLMSCADNQGNSTALLGLVTDNYPAQSNSYYYDSVYPPYWLNWTTDGAPSIECGSSYLAGGVKCSGRYCDDVSLLCRGSGYSQASSWWTDIFPRRGPTGGCAITMALSPACGARGAIATTCLSAARS